MDDWEKLNATSLLEKEDFYSHVNMEDITDADYEHAKRVCKDFKIWVNIVICILKHTLLLVQLSKRPKQN